MNVRHKLCRHPQCKLVPTYGMMGTRVPVACLKHSDGDMVDLKRERMRTAKEKKRAMSAAAAAAPSSARSGSGNGSATARRAGIVEATVEILGGRAGPGATTTTIPPAGKKRRRANHSLGGNPGIGRKIVDAIFASSQRVLEGEEAAATEESEWEEGSGDGQEGHEEGDDSDEEEAVGEKGKEKEDVMSGGRAYVPPSLLSAAMYPPPSLPVVIPPLLPPTDPPIAKTGHQRRPFHESPLALLPGVVPRGGSTAHALEMVAAVAAAASVAEHPAQDETNAATEEDGIGAAGKRPRRELSKERPSISVNNPNAPREARPGPGSGPGLGLEVAISGQQREGHQQRCVGDMGACGAIGTSLSWSCAQCGNAVAPDDRHVLVCCGHGVLHKACTAVYVNRACPCPKCFRLVSSSLQIFM